MKEKQKMMFEILQHQIREICDKFKIEIIIKNKEDKPVDKNLIAYIFQSLLAGMFIQDIGGIKEYLKLMRSRKIK